MTISVNTVWEMRSAGHVDNGGAFVEGASGADVSQQDAAEHVYTDLTKSGGTAELNSVAIVQPLYLYDHGGITMNTTGFSCSWDSGQVVPV